MENSWGMGEEGTSTRGMVGKDHSRVSANCLVLEALLGGNMKLYLKIRKMFSLCVYLQSLCIDVI